MMAWIHLLLLLLFGKNLPHCLPLDDFENLSGTQSLQCGGTCNSGWRVNLYSKSVNDDLEESVLYLASCGYSSIQTARFFQDARLLIFMPRAMSPANPDMVLMSRS